MRVTVYVEGVREGGPGGVPHPAPTELVPSQHLGPAHVFVERCLAESGVATVEFLAPLLFRGRHAQGSMLQNPAILRKLLAWPERERAPALAVVFVDSDGSNQRYRQLDEVVSKRATAHPPVVIAVPEPEFEAWLIADHRCAASKIGKAVPTPGDPQSMEPRRCKQTLDQWVAHLPLEAKAQARVEIARHCDMDDVTRQCRSFEQFRKALRQVCRARP